MSHMAPVLAALAEPKYREFSSSLLPGVDGILGVRLPALRKLAAQIVREEDWRAFLAEPGDTFEEIMLRGMVIGRAKADWEEILGHTMRFLPQINNWSVCDSACAGYLHAKTHPEEVFALARECLSSPDEFTVRFGVVLLLDHFMDESHIEEVLCLLATVSHGGYYARMAVAWALSICYVHFPDATLPLLQSGKLDEFTHNKTIQKIIESRRVEQTEKQALRLLRR